MENPENWNEVQKIISEAIQEHDRSLRSNICGISLVSRIYNALNVKGYLNDVKGYLNDKDKGEKS